jgi:hypothetical protein
MKLRQRSFLIVTAAMLSMALAFPISSLAAKCIVFSGALAGGTFQVVANAVQVYGPIENHETFKVKSRRAGNDRPLINGATQDWGLY